MLHNQDSYYDSFKRSKGVRLTRQAGGASGIDADRLLTDRAAYLSFLEVQMERVSAACMTSQAFGDRIEQVQGQVITVESKVNNLARLVKLAQSYAEQQGDDLSSQMGDMNVMITQATNKAGRAAECVDRCDAIERRLDRLEEVVKKFETRFLTSVEACRKESYSEARAVEARMMDLMEQLRQDVIDKFSVSENRISALLEKARGDMKALKEEVFSAGISHPVRELVETQISNLHDVMERRLVSVVSLEAEKVGQQAQSSLSDREGELSRAIDSLRREIQSKAKITDTALMEIINQNAAYNDTQTVKIIKACEQLEKRMGETINAGYLKYDRIIDEVKNNTSDVKKTIMEKLSENNLEQATALQGLRLEYNKLMLDLKETCTDNRQHIHALKEANIELSNSLGGIKKTLIPMKNSGSISTFLDALKPLEERVTQQEGEIQRNRRLVGEVADYVEKLPRAKGTVSLSANVGASSPQNTNVTGGRHSPLPDNTNQSASYPESFDREGRTSPSYTTTNSNSTKAVPPPTKQQVAVPAAPLRLQSRRASLPINLSSLPLPSDGDRDRTKGGKSMSMTDIFMRGGSSTSKAAKRG